MQEIWKDIKGYEGFYQISNLGRVKSLHYKNVYSNKEKVLRERDNQDGYVSVVLKGKKHYIHRLVAGAFVENPNQFKEVNHIDGNKRNNNAINLEWCTRSQNIIHAIEIGLLNKAKLVERMRALGKSGIGAKARYGK